MNGPRLAACVLVAFFLARAASAQVEVQAVQCPSGFNEQDGSCPEPVTPVQPAPSGFTSWDVPTWHQAVEACDASIDSAFSGPDGAPVPCGIVQSINTLCASPNRSASRTAQWCTHWQLPYEPDLLALMNRVTANPDILDKMGGFRSKVVKEGVARLLEKPKACYELVKLYAKGGEHMPLKASSPQELQKKAAAREKQEGKDAFSIGVDVQHAVDAAVVATKLWDCGFIRSGNKEWVPPARRDNPFCDVADDPTAMRFAVAFVDRMVSELRKKYTVCTEAIDQTRGLFRR